jgi:hypothetical protein
MIRRSSELDDDEGKVFIAYVPGASFAVLGRRGNDGRLYVGQTFSKNGNVPLDDIRDVVNKRRIELVTGAEAEALFTEIAVENLAQHIGATVVSVEHKGDGVGIARLKRSPRQ